jgi:hypothetical protein
MTRYAPRTVALLCAVALSPTAAAAHEGPPFPIVVDRAVGPYLVSVWTDPDIGIGTFYVVLEAPRGAAFAPPDAIRIGVAPRSGRLAEVVYDARPERVRHGARFVAEVELDRGEMWRVRVVIEGPAGGGVLETEVEATPDGTLGPIGLVVYAFPFVLVALLWWRAAVVRRRIPGVAASAPPAEPPRA